MLMIEPFKEMDLVHVARLTPKSGSPGFEQDLQGVPMLI
jgi:hypothetical protein